MQIHRNSHLEKNIVVGFFALLISALVFSSSGVAVRYLGETYSNVGQVAIRGALAAALGLVTYITFPSLGKVNAVDKKSWRNISKLALIVLMVAQPLANLSFASSAMLIKASNTIVYLYVAQMSIGFVLGRIVNKEQIKILNIQALAIMALGILIFSWPINTTFSYGVLLGLGAGTFEALRNLAMSRLKGYNKLLLTTLSYLATAVFLFSYLTATGDRIQHGNFDYETFVAFAVIVPAAVIISYLMFYGMQNVDTNLGNMVVASEIGFAMMVNAIMLKEYPTTNEFVGALIIWFALFVVQKASSQTQKTESE